MRACWFKLSILITLVAVVHGYAQVVKGPEGNRTEGKSGTQSITSGANQLGSTNTGTIQQFPPTPTFSQRARQIRAVKQQQRAQLKPVYLTDSIRKKDAEYERHHEDDTARSHADASLRSTGPDVAPTIKYWRPHHKKRRHRQPLQIAGPAVVQGTPVIDTIHQNTVPTSAGKSGDSTFLIVLGNLILLSIAVYAYWPKKK